MKTEGTGEPLIRRHSVMSMMTRILNWWPAKMKYGVGLIPRDMRFQEAGKSVRKRKSAVCGQSLLAGIVSHCQTPAPNYISHQSSLEEISVVRGLHIAHTVVADPRCLARQKYQPTRSCSLNRLQVKLSVPDTGSDITSIRCTSRPDAKRTDREMCENYVTCLILVQLRTTIGFWNSLCGRFGAN
jgi:hypothetical protein